MSNHAPRPGSAASARNAISNNGSVKSATWSRFRGADALSAVLRIQGRTALTHDEAMQNAPFNVGASRISLYRHGFFGGGGMGWYLKRTTQQLESTRVAAILLVIIGLVLVAEIGSGWLRKRIGKMQ
jgi:hypothetical protein